MVYTELASALGLSLPVFHYLLCFLGTIPVAFFHRFVPTVAGRHSYAFASGAVLTYLAFGNEVIYLYIPTVVAYLSMVLYRKKAGTITFFLTFAFLIYCHVTYMSGDSWKKGNIDFTGALMILSLKVISAAVNYQDGLLPEGDLRPPQKKYRLTRLPNPLEFLGFIFSDGTLLAGPPFEMADYLAYTERKREWSLDKKSWPSPYKAAGLTLCKTIISMAVYQYLTPIAPISYFATSDYINSPFLKRLWFQYLVGLVTRWKYYFIWSISECALILSGQGFSGYDEQKRATWTMAKNADILKVELAESAVTLPHYWNIQVGNWLRLYVYDRLTRKGRKAGFWELLATQSTSAIWHGLYPGYMCFFVNSAIMISGSRILHKYFLAVKEKVPSAWPVTYFLHWFYSALANNYACIGFVLLSFRDTIAAYRSVYFIGTVVPIIVVLLGKAFPPPRTRSKDAASAKAKEGAVETAPKKEL